MNNELEKTSISVADPESRGEGHTRTALNEAEYGAQRT